MFPILKPFARIAGKVDDEHDDQHQKLLHDEENGKKKKNKKKAHEPPALDDEASHDPLNYLGFGMIAYRDLMFTMFWLFALCSLIMTPAMFFYQKGGI